MTPLFLQYPACSTCQKAKKWLTENNIEYTNRLIVEENPTIEELRAWIPRSGLPIKKFFNTSGLVYKETETERKAPKHERGGTDRIACYKRKISKTTTSSNRQLCIGRFQAR